MRFRIASDASVPLRQAVTAVAPSEFMARVRLAESPAKTAEKLAALREAKREFDRGRYSQGKYVGQSADLLAKGVMADRDPDANFRVVRVRANYVPVRKRLPAVVASGYENAHGHTVDSVLLADLGDTLGFSSWCVLLEWLCGTLEAFTIANLDRIPDDVEWYNPRNPRGVTYREAKPPIGRTLARRGRGVGGPVGHGSYSATISRGLGKPHDIRTRDDDDTRDDLASLSRAVGPAPVITRRAPYLADPGLKDELTVLNRRK